MQNKINPILSISKLRYLLLLNIAAFFILIGLYGRDAGYYTASQTALFLAINKLLCVDPKFWMNITLLGDVAVLLPILSVAILRNTRIWSSLLGSIPMALLLTHGDKLLFKIPRPAAIIDNSHFKIVGDALKGCTSLPSGHSLTIFAAVTILLKISVFDNKAKHQGLWTMLLILIASVVAVSRITVGAHWPVDVLAGAVLGSISGMSGVYLSDRYTAWWRWMNNVKYAHFHIMTILLFLYAVAIREQSIAIYWLSTIVGVFVITNLAIAIFNYRWTPAYS